MSDVPRIPSPFQRFSGSGKFEVTGDFPSVTAEQRRLLLEDLLTKMFKAAKRGEIALDGKVSYVPDHDRGYRSSIVRVQITVPAHVAENGRHTLKVTVPASGDWGLVVIQRVLGYVQAWLDKLPEQG